LNNKEKSLMRDYWNSICPPELLDLHLSVEDDEIAEKAIEERRRWSLGMLKLMR